MDTATALYIWAKGKPERRIRLEEWQDAAVMQIAAGGGKDVISTSTNGVSVAFNGASGTTAQAWFEHVTLALQYLDRNPVSKIKGVFR